MASFNTVAGCVLASALFAMVVGKVSNAVVHPHKLDKPDLKQVQRIYDSVESKDEPFELNLYFGTDEDNAEIVAPDTPEPAVPGQEGSSL